jgi:Cu+-exporting ATPase
MDLPPNIITIKFIPDAIKGRELAFYIEDNTDHKVSIYHDNSKRVGLVERNQRTMKMWLNEFLLSLVFTLPIFVLSMIVARVVSHEDLTSQRTGPHLPVYNLAMWILATPVQFIFGWRFYKGGYKSLRHGTANMDVLVALGTSAAYGYGSLMNILYLAGYEKDNTSHYLEAAHSFETSALLISIILFGKWLESRSKHRTTDAITKLAGLQISSAVLVENSVEREVPLELLEIGNRVRVYPGSSIPVDGTVVEGEARVNEAMMTGESELVHKVPGSLVFGGTVNANGNIVVEISKLGKDTALAQIISLVENAQATKMPIQAVADKISKVFVPTVVMFALMTWGIWFSLTYNVNYM